MSIAFVSSGKEAEEKLKRDGASTFVFEMPAWPTRRTPAEVSAEKPTARTEPVGTANISRLRRGGPQ